jgi:nucleoid DNA-binding protein
MLGYKGDKMKMWEKLKCEGLEHYKTGGTEAIDIYKNKGVFKPFALCSIVKYATRNMDKELNPKDIIKIIHYAEFLLAEQNEKDVRNLNRQGKDQLKDIVKGKG